MTERKPRYDKVVLIGVDADFCNLLDGTMIGDDICELDNGNGKYSIVKKGD